MNATTQTNPLKNFVVIQDGEVIQTGQNTPVHTVRNIMDALQLQATMAFYDTLHGTHYRDIRNSLARERRNREFEERIGLIPVTKKTPRG